MSKIKRHTKSQLEQLTVPMKIFMTIPLKGLPSYAYLPQANGMIEIFDRTRKAYLNASHTGSNWVVELP